VILPDGAEGWNEWTDRAIFDDAGKIVEYQSVGRDITVSRRTQQALQQSEALLRKIIDNSPNSLFLKDRDGRYIIVNRAMGERNTTTSGDMIGRPDTEFAVNWLKTPDDIEKFRASERKIIDGNEIAFVPAREYTLLDGTTRWFQTTKVPISMAGGRRCLLGVSVDVTEYKRAEEERRQAEEQYRSTFESVTNGLTVRDTDGNVVAVNPAMCQLYGYTREEYLNLTLRDLMPPETYPAIVELRKTMAAGRTFAMEAKGLHKSGRLMDLEIRVTPFQYRGRAHTLTIAWDITERKRAEDQLVKLNEQLLMERQALDEKNIALGEILNHVEQDREKYKHEICESVEKLILPTVSKLAERGGHLGPTEIAVLKNALEAIVQKDIDTFASNMSRLSARELDICDLIKAGCSSKEISQRLNISLQTVHTHRHAIRRKLQLKNKSVNLAAYLRSR
jgi:PAS domain S-box-containing protein